MRIYSWNVNGIRSAEKKGVVDWFKKTQPELLCLQETRAELDQVPEELRLRKDISAIGTLARKRRAIVARQS